MAKNSDVHVWNDTLDGWRPPADVPAIAREMQARQRAGAAAATGASGCVRVPPRRPASRPLRRSAGSAAGTRPSARPATHRTARTRQRPRHSHAPKSSPATAASGWAWPASRPWSPRADAAAGGRPRDPRHAGADPGAGAGAQRATTVPRRTARGWRSPPPRLRPARSPTVESDALNALNLGGSWRQPSAPLGPTDARFSSASIAAATGARPGSRTAKLAAGAALLAGICVALFFVAFKKPAATADRRQPQGRAASGRGQGPRAARGAVERGQGAAGRRPDFVGRGDGRWRAQDRDRRARRREEDGAPRARAQSARAWWRHDADRDVAGRIHVRAARRRLALRRRVGPRAADPQPDGAGREGDAEPGRHHARRQQQQGRHQGLLPARCCATPR